jgi:S-adenosylmethionine hydrolase
VGTALRIDKFGNIITNFRRSDLGERFRIRVAGSPVTRLCRTFWEANPGELVAVEGSAGFIELALNKGSAADGLKVERGAEIELETGSVNL